MNFIAYKVNLNKLQFLILMMIRDKNKNNKYRLKEFKKQLVTNNLNLVLKITNNKW